jgi:hypothetical protein
MNPAPTRRSLLVNRRRSVAVLVIGAGLLAMVAGAGGAYGSSVASAAFSGGAGTLSIGGTQYAKQGGALTLTVTTSADTECVDVTGAFTGHQQSASPKSSWSFSFTAPAGDGVQTVTASASPRFNSQGVCNGSSQNPGSASYVLDNTGPAVTGALSPTPNGAGWNKSNVSIVWSATDNGSGVGSAPTPANDSVSANTSGTTKTATATDRLGNTGTGSVVVKLDKVAPTITGGRSPAANSNGWNNTNVTTTFSCSDALSGVKSCPTATTLTANGAGQSVSGTATDNADNTASATVGPINIDKVAPTLSGAPTTSPNAAGWYNAPVTIHWACADALSGITGSCPGDDTISGEGTGLSATETVTDNAGNQTTASSSPTVKIDMTPPNTDAVAPTGWNNTDVTVALNAHDALSGVAATDYTINGGPVQTYDPTAKITFSAEGVYTLEWWSVDNAGNTERHHTVSVNIDKTPPTIGHVLLPVTNTNGWENADTTVRFQCTDALSGIASCTADQVVTTEGKDQLVTGTAVDNAGNQATDPALVSIDKTPPSITAAVDRQANAHGWYNQDVTVTFSCADALSGIDHCPSQAVLGEGANQTVHGTAVDAAGNQASDGVSGISVDETPPTIAGEPTSTPNANGWYRDDVTFNWTCSDALSGLAGPCPDSSIVTGEGASLSVSESIPDQAGNTASATIDHIRIDRTPPTTTASVPDPLASGWYAGPVDVTLSASDALSGVAATYYRVDGGDRQTVGPDGKLTVSGGGTHTVTFWSEDQAGNVEDATIPGHSITISIDNIPPTITPNRVPAANSFGWNNTAVTVSFACADAESGIALCSDPVTLANDGAGQAVVGQAQDNAGNTATATADGINIDQMPPSLVGQVAQNANPTTDPAGNKWFNGDVNVHWTATDGLSGVDPATLPADTTVTGEGRDLGAGPVSVSDEAGNSTSATYPQANQPAINIDRHGPIITGAPTTLPNAAGWYTSDVVVGFACSDPTLLDGSNGSGVATCPSNKVITGQGTNLSVTSGPASDYAGNTTPGINVGGINIDGAPPQTTASIQCTSKNGYCTGTSATVLLSAQDTLSGVKAIHYSINGGPYQVATGSDLTPDPATDATTIAISVPLSGTGNATVAFYGVDNADNREPANTIGLQYDNIAPMVWHTLDPLANAAGWSNSDTTVHFLAQDDTGGSGVDPSTITPDVTITTEGAGQRVVGQASDYAGNTGYDRVSVSLDKTPPDVAAAITSGPKGSNGWYIGPVTVHFTCSDGLSGIVVCPDDAVLATNGVNQSAAGRAIDVAGNSSTASIGGISIDQEPPTITGVNVANGLYTLGSAPKPSCTASDSYSGVASCTVHVSGGLANGVGTFSYTATATDNAGNTTTQTGTYRVIYNVPMGQAFFLQPINDTAHMQTLNTSIFKGGSTIAAKFQLKDTAGNIVQANSLPTWELPVQGSPITAAVNEAAYTSGGDTTGTYRWDSTSQQYIYNWSTSSFKTGYYYRIGVKLDDGQTYYVNIGLR